jgi:hypothetical protein
MREALFILIVLAVLFGLTLIRYRKTVMGMIGIARTLKEIREGTTQPDAGRSKAPTRKALVSCSKCGVWVPQDRVLRSKNADYCSEACMRVPTAT